ncbi:dicarboxylate/amino acid:cation symporter [Sedimentibacter sp. zth1]|uniref:dicarboxylate/amino acid:cation symporter n=1 Tax=Sedimentibacter sp. zth1 TaxID=2816908 RepID=UPI001A928764|nr:dicarboxylate/amino acid:cation symporter [Sedimentibacter sp. zth1]QSX05604.1 dicarboxylate/amino acid:cation symporter [Sedimentibacter sp. zth1]
MYLHYITIIVLIVVFLLLYFLKRKDLNFGGRVLIAMFLGILAGAIFKKDVLIIEPIGKIFIGLIKMLVIPLVMSSLISNVTSLNNTTQLRKIGVKTFLLLLLTTGIASVIGIFTANIMNLGVGVKFAESTSFEAKEILAFSKVLLDMIPLNPISSMANGQVIPIIIFCLFIAIAIIIESEKNPRAIKPFKDFIDSFAKIMFSLTQIIIELAPYGVFSLMASVAAKNGISTLLPLAKFIVAIYVACTIHILATHGSLLMFVGKVNPIKFFKKLYPAQVVAFTTQSSYGTLPVTLKVLTERVKISEKIASFGASIGTTVGLNGCGGIYPALVAIFIARMFNIDFTLNHYLILVLTNIISSIGIAGVPGAATMATTVVLANLGLPVEGLAMVLGIDVVIDMARTMTNVTGASVVSFLVANFENEFDREAFNKDDKTITSAKI